MCGLAPPIFLITKPRKAPAGENKMAIGKASKTSLEFGARAGRVERIHSNKKQSDIRFATSFPGLSRRGRACP
jgi:hypothetical protein